MPDQTTDINDTDATETHEPVQSTIASRSLNALGVGVLVGVLAVGATLGLRHFVFEPIEGKDAFIQVAQASEKELSAKSYDELIGLKLKLYHYQDQPGMYGPAHDAGLRVERAINAKDLYR